MDTRLPVLHPKTLEELRERLEGSGEWCLTERKEGAITLKSTQISNNGDPITLAFEVDEEQATRSNTAILRLILCFEAWIAEWFFAGRDRNTAIHRLMLRLDTWIAKRFFAAHRAE